MVAGLVVHLSKAVNVVVKAEDGAGQQKGLGNVHQDATGDVLFVDGLVRSKRNAAYNE